MINNKFINIDVKIVNLHLIQFCMNPPPLKKKFPFSHIKTKCIVDKCAQRRNMTQAQYELIQAYAT